MEVKPTPSLPRNGNQGGNPSRLASEPNPMLAEIVSNPSGHNEKLKLDSMQQLRGILQVVEKMSGTDRSKPQALGLSQNYFANITQSSNPNSASSRNLPRPPHPLANRAQQSPSHIQQETANALPARAAVPQPWGRAGMPQVVTGHTSAASAAAAAPTIRGRPAAPVTAVPLLPAQGAVPLLPTQVFGSHMPTASAMAISPIATSSPPPRPAQTSPQGEIMISQLPYSPFPASQATIAMARVSPPSYPHAHTAAVAPQPQTQPQPKSGSAKRKRRSPASSSRSSTAKRANTGRQARQPPQQQSYGVEFGGNSSSSGSGLGTPKLGSFDGGGLDGRLRSPGLPSQECFGMKRVTTTLWRQLRKFLLKLDEDKEGQYLDRLNEIPPDELLKRLAAAEQITQYLNIAEFEELQRSRQLGVLSLPEPPSSTSALGASNASGAATNMAESNTSNTGKLLGIEQPSLNKQDTYNNSNAAELSESAKVSMNIPHVVGVAGGSQSAESKQQ